MSVAAADHQVRLAGVIQAGGGDPNVVIALCSGLGEVESSRPAVRLYGLAAMVRDRKELRDIAEHGDIDTLRRMFEDDASDVGDAYRSLLFDFGYRGQGEADPTNADWSEEPTFALSQVRSMLAVPDEDSPLANIARAMKRREALESDLRSSLPTEAARRVRRATRRRAALHPAARVVEGHVGAGLPSPSFALPRAQPPARGIRCGA